MHNISRAEPRREYHHQIEYISDPSSSETDKAVTIDISESGLGLYVFKNLSIGQQITITGTFHGVHKTGTIRWIMKANGDIYRVGVMFAR